MQVQGQPRTSSRTAALYSKILSLTIQSELGSSGACLISQHLGGRSRWILEFEASLVHTVGYRTARTIRENLSPKANKNNQTTAKPHLLIPSQWIKEDQDSSLVQEESDIETTTVGDLLDILDKTQTM